MKNIIIIEDMTDEVYYINPRNVAYIKEKRNVGSTRTISSWKISLINGESIITQNKNSVQALVDTFIKKETVERPKLHHHHE